MNIRKKIAVFFVLFMFACGVSAGEVKNVIWIIGDGMGPELMGFFMQGVKHASIKIYPDKTSNMEKMMNKGQWGLFFNNTYDTAVTDSAAAGTQMAIGKYSRPEYIGVDYNGEPSQTILELAKEKGKSVGIVSDAYVTDATPAAFVAHVSSRGHKTEIARQMIDLEPDVILGGGLKYFNSGDNKNLLKKARMKGYQTVFNKEELAKIKKGKLLGLFSEQGMPVAIEMYQYPHLPSLAEQTRKALDLLSQNEEGFFLMVEAGKIDWTAHSNEEGATFHEMLVLDAALKEALDFAEKNPDTLIYLNADHDTGMGGFTYRYLNGEQASRKTSQGEVLYGYNVDYASLKEYDKMVGQKRYLYNLVSELKKMPSSQLNTEYIEKRFSEALGYPVDISSYKNPLDLDGLVKQMTRDRGFAWATGTHTSAPVLSVAYGPAAEKFTGIYHNTDIFGRLVEAYGWTEETGK